MRYSLLTVLLACGFLLGGSAIASGESEGEHDNERAEHFEGEAAADIAEARANLAAANAELRELLSQDELSSADMARVHEISYTMENAIQRVQTDLEEAAVALEEVHLASEEMDRETVNRQAPNYLDLVTPLEE